MRLPLTDYKGFKCFATNMSYECPRFALYGYRSELALHRAIDKKLTTQG